MRREPRNWRKYWHSYLAHVAQGLVVGFALPTTVALVLAFVGYLVYQVVEYGRFRDMDSGVKCSDWPSRDIADFMLGLWVGLLLQVAQRRCHLSVKSWLNLARPRSHAPHRLWAWRALVCSYGTIISSRQ